MSRIIAEKSLLSTQDKQKVKKKRKKAQRKAKSTIDRRC